MLNSARRRWDCIRVCSNTTSVNCTVCWSYGDIWTINMYIYIYLFNFNINWESERMNWCGVNTTTFTYFSLTRKYYPSSKQFRDPPTYTHQPSMQQKVPFSLIRCSSSKVAFCSCVEWGWHIYDIVESESDPLTRRAVDLFEKEPLKGNSEVHLHTPTKFDEDLSKDRGGDREQTDRQTNRQTDKRCSIYSMMPRVQFCGEQERNLHCA